MRETLDSVMVAKAGETPAEREVRVAAWLIGRARARNTSRSYAKSWEAYGAWCAERGYEAIPGTAAQVREWVSGMVVQGLAVSTVRTRLAGVRRGYLEAMGPQNPSRDPTVDAVVDGLRREKGLAQRRVQPVTRDLLVRCIEALPRTQSGHLTARSTRDRALLLLGYAGGLRRSELVALNWVDLEWEEQGVVLLLRSSKTDQYGHGARVAVGSGTRPLTCPVCALRDWRTIAHGAPLLTGLHRHRTGTRLPVKAVNATVKAAVQRIGLCPDDYAGHSLRAGLVTDLAPLVEAVVGMRQTRHRSPGMWMKYYRPEERNQVNFSELAGL